MAGVVFEQKNSKNMMSFEFPSEERAGDGCCMRGDVGEGPVPWVGQVVLMGVVWSGKAIFFLAGIAIF